MGITSSQEFADNVSYYLLEATTKTQADARRQPLSSPEERARR
jgi:hypothetical protein